MGFIPILSVNVSLIIDTMLKFDASADANVNIDAQCEQIFHRPDGQVDVDSLIIFQFKILYFSL